MKWHDAKPPLAVEIEIASDCNRKCAYCPNSKFARPEQGRMEERLFRRILNQLSDIRFKGRISYHFYNEPLLSPDLDLFTALTREVLPDSRIELFTNGTLLGKERLTRLLDLGVHKFTVTRHAGANLSAFEKALSELDKNLKERIRYKSHEDLIYTSRGGLVPGFTTFKVQTPLKRQCFVPLSVSVITVKGNVVPCFEDYLQENVMGNVDERHFGEIWTSPKYVEFREKLKRGERDAYPVCRSCDYVLVVS